jgi:hypothetical protein
MAPVVFRLAKPQDYPAILRLQSANFIENSFPRGGRAFFRLNSLRGKSPRWRRTSARPSLPSMATWSRSSAHAAASSIMARPPVIAKMLESYDRVKLDGKTLGSYNSYVYGPVCIDRAYRGRGLLRGLYEAQNRHLRGVLKSAWLSFPATIPILSRLT